MKIRFIEKNLKVLVVVYPHFYQNYLLMTKNWPINKNHLRFTKVYKIHPNNLRSLKKKQSKIHCMVLCIFYILTNVKLFVFMFLNRLHLLKEFFILIFKIEFTL